MHVTGDFFLLKVRILNLKLFKCEPVLFRYDIILGDVADCRFRLAALRRFLGLGYLICHHEALEHGEARRKIICIP